MKVHTTADGSLMRCRATKRKGQGVSDCPLEQDGSKVRHYDSLLAIAKDGGGTIKKPIGNGEHRFTEISGLLPGGGFLSDTGKLKRTYDDRGKLVPFKNRSLDPAINEWAITKERAKFIADNAPYELREFFKPLTKEALEHGDIFDAWRAYYAFADHELSSEQQRKLRVGTEDQMIAVAISELAHPDFENNEEWQKSMNRRVMHAAMPQTLARLERQAEDSQIDREFFA
ncbi:hypothetical protein M3672_15005 [Microbacterium enclense]|uniref:hypothetical protein n=1 Tax=Microbacterium enclense TaxID=993073 RepID=UPI002040AEDF|nr:hypothetical protein [Microbacterium enclense]MCM3615739.1 hypothetical protein [Microbacterium enclense]